MNIAISLCPRVDRLATQVEQLMHSQSYGDAAINIDVGALTQDILERVNKACNIILYNVLEPLHALSNTGFTESLRIYQNLSSIRGITLPEHLTFSRLPTRPGDAGARPLKVRLLIS